MHQHGANELAGPVRGSAAWWRGLEAPTADDGEGAPEEEPPARRGRQRKPTGIRQELVDRVRKEIAAGTYDTPEKWEATLDRLLNRLDHE